MKSLIAVSLVLLLFVPALSQTEDHFQQGVAAYTNHDYEAALQHFQTVFRNADAPVGSSLYYNLGNCYYRLDQPGLARYNYEMAVLLNPAEEDAHHNIEIIEQTALSPEMTASNFAGFDVTMLRLLEIAQPQILFWLAVAAFLLINAIIFVRIIKPDLLSITSMWLFLIPLCLVLLVCTSVALGYQILDSQIRFGVVTGSNDYAYSEPSLRAPGKFPVPEAAKARIKREVDGWLEISLPDKTTGWIKADDIALIRNDSN